MKILVLGAGGIGGYFGAKLVAAGADATFLVRPRRAAQLAADGLVVRSPLGDTVQRVRTTTAEAPGGPYDAVLLSCKAFDLDSAMDAIAPVMGPGTAVAPMLNGMAHLDVLRARFGDGAVLGGQCQIAATLDADGTVRHLGPLQALSVGELDGAMSPRVQALGEAFRSGGGRASGTILQDMWEKWVFLSSLAALTGLMRAAVGDVVAAGGTFVAHGLFDEASAVAAAAGHTPRPAFVERMRGVIAQPGSTFTASMMRDMEAGGRIEADHVVGDLVARGGTGSMPLFRMALVALKAYEARRAREAG